METPKRAHANVSFSLAPPKNPSKDAARQLAITLVPEHGAWRIYDIEDDSDSSTTFALRKLIQDDIDTVRQDAGSQTQATSDPQRPSPDCRFKTCHTVSDCETSPASGRTAMRSITV